MLPSSYLYGSQIGVHSLVGFDFLLGRFENSPEIGDDCISPQDNISKQY